MTKTMTIDDLLKALRASDSACYDLDRAISEFTGTWRLDGQHEQHRAPLSYTFNVGDALGVLPDDVWWLMAKGRIEPGEPLYGIQLFPADDYAAEDDDALAEAEHECLPYCILIAAFELRKARQQ